jgi:hypothetical protein
MEASSEIEVVAQELSVLGQRLSDIERRMPEGREGERAA